MRLSRILVTVVCLFIITMSGLLVRIPPVKADVTVYHIYSDGSIDPPTSSISTSDNITYTVTGNISGSIYVYRSNIVLEGAGYTIEGNASGYGIGLFSVSNVTVEDTYTRAFDYGIFLQGSSNCTLLGNTVSQNTVNGIGFYASSSNNMLSGNTVTGSGYGFYLIGSSFNTFLDNNATGNGNAGYYIFSNSNNNTLSGNIASGNSYGIDVRASSNNTLLGNNVFGNSWRGVSLRFSANNNALFGNNVSGNSQYGVYVISSSNNNTFSGNSLSGNSPNGGFDFEYSAYNTLSGNNISGNADVGIRFLNSSYNTLLGNRISGNQASGVYALTNSSSNLLSDNNITGNSIGVYVGNSPGTILSENNVTGNSAHGIYLCPSPGSILSGNNVSQNGDMGVYLYNSSNSTLLGNTASGNVQGFHLYQSSNCTLTGNNVSGNRYGLYLSPSPGDTLRENVIDNNVYNFGVSGSTLSDYIHSIDTSNLINGKPIYYYINETGLVINPATHPSVGYLALINCTNITVEDLNLTNNGEGILLRQTANSTITGSNLANNEWGAYLYGCYNITLSNDNETGNGYHGIYIVSSSYNTLIGNNASGNGDHGIYLYSSYYNALSGNNASGNGYCGISAFVSDNSTLSDNNASGNYYGIYLSSSSSCTLSGNTASGNGGYGILVEVTENNTLSNNKALGNSYGIYLYSSSNCTLLSNNASGNSNYGVLLYYSSNNNVLDNFASENSYGFYLIESPDNVVRQNIMNNNTYNLEVSGYDLSKYINSIDTSNLINGKPIYYYINETGLVINPATHPSVGYLALINCTSITVEDLNLTNNGEGVLLAYTNSSTITGNNLTSNDYGAYLIYSWYNALSGNNASGNFNYGIYLTESSYNALSGNNVSGNSYGFYLESSSYNTFPGNNVSGNSNYGFSIDSSDDNAVSSNTVTGNGFGFYLGSSSNNWLLSNNVSGNGGYGVYLAGSSFNAVSGNNVSGNSGPGILLIDSSTGNTVSGNVLTGNAVIGIDVYSSSANTVSGNNVTGSSIGIEVDYSSGNVFYHNNFVDNTQQTLSYGIGPNAWDNGYPSGGNYWSDYAGTDVYKGPGQNVPGSDGIGDIPYVIDIDNTDNYPFMQPWTAAPAGFVPLSGWTMDPLYTNAPYFLSSGTSDLFLRLDATDTNSRVTVSNLDTPKLNLSDYAYIDVAVSGTANARILLRFFLDDGTGFDVVWWGSPAELDATKFNLSPYAGRTLTIAYVALMSSDGLTAAIDITGITFVAEALPPVVPLSGWTVDPDPSLTNAAYTLSSTETSLSLGLSAVDTSSRVTIYTLGVPTLNLGDYDHIDVTVTGTANARILLRFFMDNGAGFDVVYWADPATLNAVSFDLSAYAGRTLTVAYVALMSSDGLDASFVITEIAFVASAPPSVVPLDGWTIDPPLTNAPYTLDSSPSLLSLDLIASDTSSRVTIYTLGVPTLDLGGYDHIDVAVTGTANARILLRFFLDDGSGFDVVYWADPVTLNVISFDLGAYAGRKLTIAYIALMSSDGLTASIDITSIAFVATAPPPVVPLSSWTVDPDPSLTNAAYTLSSTETSLSLGLSAVDTSSRVTIYTLGVPTSDLGGFDHIDVSVTGTSNARILLRFFVDDGTGFDVVYWADPTTLNAINFDLSAYAGRTLTIAYVALMSSDGSTASIDITQIAFIAV